MIKIKVLGKKHNITLDSRFHDISFSSKYSESCIGNNSILNVILIPVSKPAKEIFGCKYGSLAVQSLKSNSVFHQTRRLSVCKSYLV